LDRDDFRRACARFATGVCVLTVRTHDGDPHGLTVNSFTSLSLDPPLVMAAIATASMQWELFEKADFFAVNILSEDQQHLSSHFSIRQEGRFQGVAWQPGATGAPVFENTLGAIECRAVHRFGAGDHRVLMGEAVAAAIREGRPLVYFRSAYATLG
jgi:flavin reductase (DIM6/NTAB) family NADH-FMN oxidoreductase RutF